MTEFIDTVTTKTKMLNGIKKMNSFGVRLTGSQSQLDFIEFLKKEIHSMGLKTYSDPYFFNRWEAKRAELKVFSENGEDNMHISSVFPYSGETDEEGVNAPLQYIKEKHVGFASAKNKIAVVKIEELDFLPSTLAFNIRNKYPASASIPEKYDGPVATSFVNFPFLQSAKDAGCKAVVCIWQKMSDEMIEGQYLPFILGYQGIPAVWVNASDGEKLIEAAKNNAEASFTLTAEKQQNAYTESFYSILPGKNTSEAIIINTHTDGTNCIEENGPIAMLSLMKYFKEKELERSLIFVFVTGHFRLPNFKTINGGGVQATSKWLSSHPDLWDGKNGHMRAVACLSVEHLGCKMFKDVDGIYQQIGDVETELVYTGNKKLDEIYYEAIATREKVNTITLRGHNFLHFGEGQPPFNCGIPEIALVTAPDYLTVISENHEMDKFDISLMFEQTDTFIRILQTLLPMTKEEIGKCEGYSFIVPPQQTILSKTLKKIIKK